MEPTISASDQVSWVEVGSGHRFQRGEIVVITSPVGQGRWIRRVIGLEDELIEVRSKGVNVDGVFYPWAQILGKDVGSTTVVASSVKIPEKHLYLIGDNLNNSRDSREFGPLPATSVVGIVK